MLSFSKIPNPLSIFSKNKISAKTEPMPIDKNYLEAGTDIAWEDAIPFTFPITGGRVIKVYDGDTITIASKLPYDASPLYRLSVRLNGLDAPEMKGGSKEEHDAAVLARDFVADLILNKYVTLDNIRSEKYGRILADVYIDEMCVNDMLIRERYAVKYDGKTKIKLSSWLKYRITGKIE
jgi:endonuclease YncB( thermonuclease family)